MKKFKIIISCILICAIFLGICPTSAFAASGSAAPSETDPFVENHYIDATDQNAPFFDVVLPAIQKNIKANNKHSISPYYDKFPVANNPENFQGLGHTTYANINGKKVTAEAFYRVKNESLCDPNNGMGLLIYQCIQYKRKHPTEDVKITFSSYRTSATAAVCVLPESKYYGYMRSLYGTNYDEHGFVRISYMLTEAARMGIEVTLVNQLNSYAVNQYNPSTKKLKSRSPLSYSTYYSRALKTDCYNKYAPGKKVSDFMNCANVGWTVSDKTADMQHVKSATVSHYLATDGKEHKSAVYFGSANLDDNNYIGANGNNGSQSGVIISDHDELYRVTYNYMQLMADYKGQEQMFELRKLVNQRNEKQAALIKSGKESQIPKDEQIIYLGTKNDPVFELYFTPFGGSADTWDTEMNPFCKYLDKLPRSTDYVELFWNEFGYGTCNIGDTFEKKLEEAFCKKPNVNNKISMRVSDFDTTEIQKLNLGTEIGARDIKNGSNIHSKDILMSYKENGVRHNVSLLTSCNFYMIAFNYRTNSMLVINETEKTGGNFYNIMGEKYSYGMINNSLMASPANLTLEEGTSKTLSVRYTGSKKLTWSTSNKSVATVKDGKVSAKKPGTATITVTDGSKKSIVNVTVVECVKCVDADGITGSINEQYVLSKQLDAMPKTMEAVFTVEKGSLKGTTTLLGNDGLYDPAITFTLNKSGQPRVAIRNKASNSEQSVYVFKNVNVATGEKVHLSIVMDFSRKKMHCYVNGKLAQTIKNIAVVDAFVGKHNYVVGGDHCNGNATYFPGVLESVAVWSDVRSSKEVAADYADGINIYDEKMLAAYDLAQCEKCLTEDISSNGNDLKKIKLWQSKKDVAAPKNYDYSFAVIGDTQTMCENDPEAMGALYDWLLANKKSQKIQYVLGLGDITDNSTDKEWEYAEKYISKLDGKIPYAVSRGNHDDLDDFNRVFNNSSYKSMVDGQMTKGDLTNTYRYFSVKGIDYLIMTLDFAPSEKVLKWADKVIKNHPYHKVIILTHAYMYRDGTTLDAGDCYPPTYYKGYTDAQNGDDMWTKCFSKHKNVLMVLSGHDPWQHVVYRQDTGKNGNLVTQMLVDAQYVDRNIGSTAMVAMFYFSNEGKTLTVRYYSVEKDCYGSELSQFTIDLEKHTHTYDTTTTDATLKKNGKTVTACTTCGYVKSSKTIYYPKTFTLSETEYTYNKKVKEPTVTVKDTKGNVLKQNKDYVVSYEDGRKLPGKYTVKITFKGNYTGVKRLYFKIKPRAATKITAKQTSTSITLSWAKVTGAVGYRVYQYNPKTKKYVKVASVKTNSYKVSKLTAGTDYKFKIRAYTKDDGTIWASYSKVFETATKTKKPSIKSISTTKGKVALSWSNVSGESGYQVYYATKKDGDYKKAKSYKTDELKGSKSELKSGKTYYFKVRAYKKTDSGTVYSGWSDVKSIKVK